MDAKKLPDPKYRDLGGLRMIYYKHAGFLSINSMDPTKLTKGAHCWRGGGLIADCWSFFLLTSSLQPTHKLCYGLGFRGACFEADKKPRNPRP